MKFSVCDINSHLGKNTVQFWTRVMCYKISQSPKLITTWAFESGSVTVPPLLFWKHVLMMLSNAPVQSAYIRNGPSVNTMLVRPSVDLPCPPARRKFLLQKSSTKSMLHRRHYNVFKHVCHRENSSPLTWYFLWFQDDSRTSRIGPFSSNMLASQKRILTLCHLSQEPVTLLDLEALLSRHK